MKKDVDRLFDNLSEIIGTFGTIFHLKYDSSLEFEKSEVEEVMKLLIKFLNHVNRMGEVFELNRELPPQIYIDAFFRLGQNYKKRMIERLKRRELVSLKQNDYFITDISIVFEGIEDSKNYLVGRNKQLISESH